MFSIIQTKRGKQEVVFTGSLPNCNDRIKTLRASKIKGCKFTIAEAADNVKFQKKPTKSFSSGDSNPPARIR